MSEIVPGTLEMLILRTLRSASLHGYGIAQHIQRVSDEVLQVQEGSLYPALQRMRLKGWIEETWKRSPTGRRARYYELTPAGEKQLGLEIGAHERMMAAINRVLREA